MSDDAPAPSDVWSDAVLAIELVAVSPAALGGMVLRAGPGPMRDQLCAWMRDLLPAGGAFLRLPIHITDDRLLGGLSLAATLRAGQVVAERGVLAQADGGIVVAAMAERLEANVTSHLCAALDRGELSIAREGITATVPCRFGVLALDEGIDDERAPEALRDRLAFHFDLTRLTRSALGDEGDEDAPFDRVDEARELLPRVVIDDAAVSALAEAAAALGILSLRAPLLAAAVARAHAAVQGREKVEEEDAAVAARLVLGPRATRIPVRAPDESDEDESDGDDDEPPSTPEPPQAREPASESEPREPPDLDHVTDQDLAEIVLDAAKSAVPAGLLDGLALGLESRRGPRSAGHAGVARSSTAGGRPAGTRAGVPREGERLNVVETLRAAAPWQRIRRLEGEREARDAAGAARTRIQVRKQDFRVTRFQQRTETSVIFAVDASGSAALQRLAEAKGAVEQVLADCYARRDHVALLAFRGTTASLLLPSTRSLARVRRSLANLAGGGATPLASGIDAALALALGARMRGKTPLLVVMTDGRANVARDGKGGSAEATADALSAARSVRAAGVSALFLDTSPRPRPPARTLAAEMGARYLPLPYVNAAGIARQIQSLADGAT